MAIEVMVDVLQHSRTTLGTRLVMLAIANNADKETRTGWPSVQTIATTANLSESAVHRAIRKAVALGELTVTERSRDNGSKRSNLYTVIVGGEGARMTPSPQVPPETPPRAARDTRVVPPAAPLEPSGEPSVKRQGDSAPKKTAWHTVPETELLTPKRRETARSVGLHPARTAQEWQKFSNYHFPKAKVDVDATWRNWCVGALDDAWTPPPDPKPPVRKEPDPPYYRKVRSGASPVDTVTPGPTRLGDILTKVAPHPPEDDTLGL